MNDPAPNSSQKNHEMDWLTPAHDGKQRPRLKPYSMFVTGMKVALPAMAVAILLAVLISSSGHAPPMQSKKNDALDATMRDAVFTARDGENPYSVEAPVARQNPATPGVIDLTRPSGTMEMGDDTLQGAAKTGTYDQKSGTLNLDGNVTVTRSDGATFKTQSATVDVNGKTMTTDQPVQLQGNFGEVRGSGLDVKDGGKVITFTGPSSAKLNMGAMPNSGPNTKPAPASQEGTKPATLPAGSSPAVPAAP